MYSENNGSKNAQGEFYPQHTEWFRITETGTGCLAISAQPYFCAEGNIDCALGIDSFCCNTDLQTKRNITKIRINNKINVHTTSVDAETVKRSPVEDCSFAFLIKQRCVSRLRFETRPKAHRIHLFG